MKTFKDRCCWVLWYLAALMIVVFYVPLFLFIIMCIFLGLGAIHNHKGLGSKPFDATNRIHELFCSGGIHVFEAIGISLLLVSCIIALLGCLYAWFLGRWEDDSGQHEFEPLLRRALDVVLHPSEDWQSFRDTILDIDRGRD